ncbi:unnamed protein product [Discula destructiva]
MPANNTAAIGIIRKHCCVDPSTDKDGQTDAAADWQYLPDLPSSEEILAHASSDDLPWFPIKHQWDSKNDYLKALYEILRFEGTEGLRYSVKTIRARPVMADDDNTCIYTKVRVQGYLFAKLGPIARVSISTQRAGAKIKWKQSKRLQPGKIVALSTDYFKTDCRVAVVAQRPIEGGLDQNPPVVDIIWANFNEAVVDPDQELVMVESRNGYYEAVRHALKGLQHAAHEWSPLDKYVVKLDQGDLPYPTTRELIDLGSLVDHLAPEQLRPGNKVAEQQVFRETEDHFKEMSRSDSLNTIKPYTSLDDSQLRALGRIITKEVAIVQGPPGTGKTFTSVKSIAAILKNRQPGDSPIIVSAQTNHALDQLLIYCKSAGAKIMRVGGRTDHDEIAKRTLYELRKAARLGGPGQNFESQRSRIVASFESLVNGVFGGAGLLDPEILLKAGVINESQCKSLADEEWEGNEDVPAMDSWLGGNKIERNRQHTDELDFDDFETEVTDEIELDLNLDDDQVDDEDDRIFGKWVSLSSRFTGRKPGAIPNWQSRCMALLAKYDDLYDIPVDCRGGVYQIMELKLREITAAKFRGLLVDAAKQAQAWKAACWIRDLGVIDRHAIDIVGCTTTGLTKYRGFLAGFLPRILLIEEAAETREANIASALFPSIQQLILVGDHQQLPPSCDIARLAKHPYNLNISLFERLVENDLPYTMLNCQRRMVPELRYIVQKYYPQLKDHPSVTSLSERPLIPGLGHRRSWFFTHQWPEDTDADNSKFNQEEVEMIVLFIRYLLHNNVKASEITVLTYYRGQKRKLLHRLRQKDIPIGNFFNVATVDSYQGEENEIVILSLVRSPAPGRLENVGFVDSRNRATVAVSRARRGFFMFGNKENILKASEDSFITWAPIWNAFAEQKRVSMSKGLPLVCQNHGKEIWVKNPDGLVGNAGGCWDRCRGRLPCGHACVLKCHNITHDKLPCLQPCPDTLKCGHKCAGYCSDPCRCAVNCPDYIRIRLEMQLADAHVEAQTLLESPGSQVVSPDGTAMFGTRSPNEWQELAINPEAHDVAMRAERQRALGDDRVTEVTLQRAFENIQETFITVSGNNGRRVTGARQATDVREESRLRQTMANLGLDGVQPTIPDARQLSIHLPNTEVRNINDLRAQMTGNVFQGARPNLYGDARLDGQSPTSNQGRPQSIACFNSGATRSRQPGGGDSHTQCDDGLNSGRHGGFQGSVVKPSEATRPTPTHTQTANANAIVRPNNGDFQALRPAINEPFLSPRCQQQDNNPDSASMIGGLGFDDELEQATQRQRTMTLYDQQRQQHPTQRSHIQYNPRAQEQSLMGFGGDGNSEAGGSQKAEEKEEKLLPDF